MTFKSANATAYIALSLAVLFWGSSFVVLKFAFRAYDPMVVIFGRMFIAAVCLMCFYPKFRQFRYQKGDIRKLLFMAICEPGLYFVFEAKALTLTDASQAGMICAMVPLLVAVAARIFLGERVSRKTILGFMLAIVGAVTLSAAAESTETAVNPALGNFYEFMAMICATGYMVTIKGLSERYNPWFLTMFQAMIGSIFFFPLMFLPGAVPPTTLDPMGMLSIVYLGVFVTIGGYGLYNVGMSKVPASSASAFINLIPVISLVLGFIFLGERLTFIQYIASAVVLLGVYISQGKSKKTATSEI